MPSLNTFFSGTTGPTGDRPGPDSVFGRMALYAVGLILFPWAVLVYLIWIGLFFYARLPWWVPGATGAALLLGGILFRGVTAEAVAFYFQGYGNLIDDIFNKGKDVGAAIGGNLGQILLGQLWLGLLAGTLFAGGATIWKYIRRDQWKEKNIMVGPFLKKRAEKTAEEIAKGINSPNDGITLGVAKDTRDSRFAGGKPGEEYGKRVVIQDAELATHTFVVGGSGAGKTFAMLSGIRDVIRRGHGIVIIDCKASTNVVEDASEWATRYGRKFYHWSIQKPTEIYDGPAEGPAYYDPLSRGDASRRKDLLMESNKWDVEYYAQIIANYLQTLFRVIDLVPALEGTDTFTDVADLLAPEALVNRGKHIDASRQPELSVALNRIAELDSQARSGINSMYSRLHTLITSTAGTWLKLDPEQNPDRKRDIDLRKVADEGSVVVFSLDTAQYGPTAKMLASLIIQDLVTLSSELRANPADSPLHIYVDEFSAVDTDNIINLLARARDAKMPCTLATQALADLARTNPNFPSQMQNIVSNFIILRSNGEADARIYAGLSGLTTKIVERMSFEKSTGILGTMGSASATGVGYAEEKEEYTVRPGVFQSLNTLEAVFIAKLPTGRYVNPVKIIPENKMFPDAQRDPGIPVSNNRVRSMVAPMEKETYPHPFHVSSGQAKAPGADTPERTAAALDVLVDITAKPKTGGPKRPQPVKEEEKVIDNNPEKGKPAPAGAPLPMPGLDKVGLKPAGAPLISPIDTPVKSGQNIEEWNPVPHSPQEWNPNPPAHGNGEDWNGIP